MSAAQRVSRLKGQTLPWSRQGQSQVCLVELNCIDLFWEQAFISAAGQLRGTRYHQSVAQGSRWAREFSCSAWILLENALAGGLSHFLLLPSSLQHRTYISMSNLSGQIICRLSYSWLDFFPLVFSFLQKQILLS